MRERCLHVSYLLSTRVGGGGEYLVDSVYKVGGKGRVDSSHYATCQHLRGRETRRRLGVVLTTANEEWHELLGMADTWILVLY